MGIRKIPIVFNPFVPATVFHVSQNTPNSAYSEAHSLSELSSIHYQINSEVREMDVIKIMFIIFWGAFMLVPLFARDAEVQDHLDSRDADCSPNDQHDDH